MSFDQLILPSSAIVSLYGHSLVESEKTGPLSKEVASTAAEGPTRILFTGGNARRVCLVMTGSADDRTFDMQWQFLMRMMAACKMELKDIAVIDAKQQTIDIRELKEQLIPAQLILFGISPLEIGLPVNFPQYKSQSYDDTIYLSVSALDALTQENEEGKLLKSKLWLCLRQLFGV